MNGLIFYLLIMPDLRFPLIICYSARCPDVTFLTMETLVWPYHYCDGDFVYLHHDTYLGAVLGFTSYTHRSYMKSTQFHLTRTQKMCKLSFMIYNIISCLCSQFHVRNQWFFYSVITFSYIKCFVHSYTVDVVFTLSYLFKNNWNADRLTIKRCSPRSYHMTESKNGTWWTNTVLKDSTMNNTENKQKILERITYSNPLMCWLFPKSRQTL